MAQQNPSHQPSAQKCPKQDSDEAKHDVGHAHHGQPLNSFVGASRNDERAAARRVAAARLRSMADATAGATAVVPLARPHSRSPTTIEKRLSQELEQQLPRSEPEAKVQPEAQPEEGAPKSRPSVTSRRSSQERRSSREARQHAMLSSMAALVGQEARETRWVIDPDLDKRKLRAWWLLTSVAFVYNLLAIPLRIGFSVETSAPLLVLDYVCDAIYLLDLGLGFFVGFHAKGNKEMRRARVQRHYLRTSFPFVALAVLPTDLLQLGLGRWEPTVRVNRLLRWPLAVRQMRAMMGVTHMTPPWFKISSVLIQLLVLAHYWACGWFLFSVFEGFGPRGGWLPPRDLNGTDYGDQYAEIAFYL
jgi:hypothetical protein